MTDPAAHDPAGPASVPPTPEGGPSEAGPATPAAGPATPAAGRFGRLGRILGRLRFLRIPRIRSRRGKFIALVLVAGFGSALTVGGIAVAQWTETADFCGRCHTMGPELKGHALSAHRELACAECHVEPGLTGWIKAKINGTRQLIEVITGTFPTPIPPPDHEDLPPSIDTCRRCHDVNQLTENGGSIKLVLGTVYSSDQANTRQSVALVLRPAGFGAGSQTKGLHWHITSDVEVSSSDARIQSVDLVQVTNDDGTVDQYVSMGQVTSATNVQPDISRILATATTRRMDCIDCHNRVGHRLPTIDEAVDDALELGTIDQSLPWIKREAVDRLKADYPTEADAFAAFEGLRNWYATEYPSVASTRPGAINAAIAEVKRIYDLIAQPDMKVSALTYPDNLGHQTFPGCMRCHDGGHYKVVNGAMTKEAIPSACSTCHTFPQVGDNTSAILIGERPDTHLTPLWVFDHKKVSSSLDPSTQTCGACHTRTYCENCHKTQAVNVPHDNMVYDHAAVSRQVGVGACLFCHQPAYCERCHPASILDQGSPGPPGPTFSPSFGPSPGSSSGLQLSVPSLSP
jgi:nitrate/TMAO reductase-like tetraheme cytochrome c subunit